ncbi:MAG: hypothetical protein HZA50_18435 [Planctomycetes bacterium]|nr:hypothetical protein [Planctomycetota bacterium]
MPEIFLNLRAVNICIFNSTLSLTLHRNAPLYWTDERYDVEIEFQNDVIKIIKCVRDEKNAEIMKQNVKMAEFIVNYITKPDQRSKWLAKDGIDELPKSTSEISDENKQQMPLEIRPQKRSQMVPFTGDPGRGDIFEVKCTLKDDKKGSNTSGYRFRVVKTDEEARPFMMFFVGAIRTK